jgi:hypothetical protein
LGLCRYANDQQAFFDQYRISYQKLIEQTTAELGQPQDIHVDDHIGLLETKQPPTIWEPATTLSTATPAVSNGSFKHKLYSLSALFFSLLL